MQRWEYRAITVARDAKGFPIQSPTDWKPPLDLNQMGEQGWELIAVVPIAGVINNMGGFTNQLQYVFKRLKLQ